MRRRRIVGVLAFTAVGCVGEHFDDDPLATQAQPLSSELAICDTAAIDAATPAPPACTRPGTTTTATTRAQLDAWRADPTTALRVAGAIAFTAGEGLSLVTACDVTVADTSSLTGLGTLVVVGRDVALGGTVRAATTVVHASRSFTGRGALSLSGDAVLTGPRVEFNGEADVRSRWCALGGAVIIGGGADIERGSIVADGSSIDVSGSLSADSNMRLQATAPTGTVLVRSGALLHARGRLHLVAGSVLDVYGDVAVADLEAFGHGGAVLRGSSYVSTRGNLNVTAGPSLEVYADLSATGSVRLVTDAMTLRDSGSIRAENLTQLLVHNHLDWYGDVTETDEVQVSAASVYLRDTGRALRNGDVSIVATGRYDMRGDLSYNRDVDVRAGEYRVYPSHHFTANQACTIAGAAVADSEAVVGCSVAGM